MISTIPKWLGDPLQSAAGPQLTVIRTEYLTPAIKRIRFRGNLAKMNFFVGGASVIRVSDTEYQNYTIAGYNIREETPDIIFHLHGNGVESHYVSALKSGDKLYLSRSRGRNEYHPQVTRYLLFGAVKIGLRKYQLLF